MKILAITQSKDIMGGANRSLIDVILTLKNNYHHEITAMAPGYGAFSDKMSYHGIKCLVTPYMQTSFVRLGNYLDIYRFVRDTYFYLKSKRYIKGMLEAIGDETFDLVYINDTTNTSAFFVAQELGIPFVWHCRGYQKSIKRYFFNEKKLNYCNGIFICISKAMKDYFSNVRKIPENKLVVVYNGVKNEANIKKQSWDFTNEIHCLHCGHISIAKGQADSVAALINLHKRGYNNIYLHLAGTSSFIRGIPYIETLKTIIRKEGLDKYFIFEGEVDDMKKIRRKMNIELMCSVCEPFGRVTVEGMQFGLVVIGADTGATPEIITNGYDGLIYKQGNPVDLADKILSVVTNKKLANTLSNNAINTTNHKFTLKNNVEEINKILISIANKV